MLMMMKSTSKKTAKLVFEKFNPDEILEADFLRWLFLMGEEYVRLVEIAKNNISDEYLITDVCKKLYQKYLAAHENNEKRDLLSFAHLLNEEEEAFFTKMMVKKVNREKAEESFIATVQKILDREWMKKREKIKQRIHAAEISDVEALKYAKEFDDIKKNKPLVKK